VTLSELYVPLIQHSAQGWDAEVTSADATQEFFWILNKCSDTVGAAVSTLNSGFMLRKPDKVRRAAAGRARARRACVPLEGAPLSRPL